MTLFEFSQSIKKLNQEKKYSDTLFLFNENKKAFSSEQIGSNRYIVYEIITALIESNHFDAIFSFVQQYNIVLESKNFSFLLKKFKGKPSVNWSVVNRFCDLISVDSLETECKTIEVVRKGETKQMELASDKENWFAYKTKALFEIKQYQECFEISKQALDTIDKFHYSNDVWFSRRIALSKKNLGNSKDALNELQLILKRKKEWFIQSEVAEIHKENGNWDEAFNYAIDAVNNFGNIEYKVGLLVLIAEILVKKQEKEWAFKHYMLSKLIRKQEEWKVPPALDLALQNLGFPQLPIEQTTNLKKELKEYWNTFKIKREKQNASQKQYLTGRIDRILHHNEKGADGFIKYGKNKSIYFRINTTNSLVNNLKVGLEVKFKILSQNEKGKKEKAVLI